MITILNDNIFELLKDENIFELFQKTGKKICTVSDFLKLDRKYFEENKNLLIATVIRLENLGLKMDYNLSEKELYERETIRLEIEKNIKNIRSQVNLEEELDKNLSDIKEIKIGNKERKFFVENGIETIRDLLELTHYQIYRIFKSNILNNLSKYLNKRGLDFNMINAFGIIDRNGFKDEKVTEHFEEEIPSLINNPEIDQNIRKR
ncbi:MAG: hypothetical protein IKJ43_03905 [Bacilli bacterium]|nr:hypothetical protein [Bacilli bacterium]